jgi:hypothetical protein
VGIAKGTTHGGIAHNETTAGDTPLPDDLRG